MNYFSFEVIKLLGSRDMLPTLQYAMDVGLFRPADIHLTSSIFGPVMCFVWFVWVFFNVASPNISEQT